MSAQKTFVIAAMHRLAEDYCRIRGLQKDKVKTVTLPTSLRGIPKSTPVIVVVTEQPLQYSRDFAAALRSFTNVRYERL